MPRFLAMPDRALNLANTYAECIPLEVYEFLLQVNSLKQDLHRYQFIRENFLVSSLDLDGTYVPEFDDTTLHRAKTLNQSVDNAIQDHPDYCDSEEVDCELV